jgi:putative phosphoesterase
LSQFTIGLISDTHGLLRPEVCTHFKGCDLILHAGDVGKPEILDELEKIAPTTAVRGNVDTERWAQRLRLTEQVEVGNWSIHVLHDVNRLKTPKGNTDIIVYGHSHRFAVKKEDGIWYVNPGSAGPRRFLLPVTIAIMNLKDAQVQVEKIKLK